MSEVSRRGFVGTAAAAGAGLAVSASANAAGRVVGANEAIRVGLIGVGGRCQGHMSRIFELAKDGEAVVPVACCDVYNVHRETAADRIDAHNAEMGITAKCKQFGDYRKMLDDPDIDAVLICTPDHWHAKMTIDAADAGKDVYCEKPMTHTIEEGYAVVDAIKRNNRVMQVGVQSTSDPIWRDANTKIVNGRIGKVVQAQTHYYRNTSLGQWRYYKLTKEMTPKNVDWDMFLGTSFGLAPKVPFDRARYFQWRCYWDYGGGMFTDLFVHRTTRFMLAMGVREPRRVVGAGGLYLEYDGRDVPDVATVVADFDEGCQLIVTASMVNDHRIEECIRGHNGTIVFAEGGKEGSTYKIIDQKVANRPTNSAEGGNAAGEEIVSPEGTFSNRGDRQTYMHWRNFLQCVRDRNQATNNPPEVGAAAITLVNLGTRSYREGKAFHYDKETREISFANKTWAKKWEKVSHKRGKPVHVMGWKAGDKGSLLQPPPYQKLEGPWIDGVDPSA